MPLKKFIYLIKDNKDFLINFIGKNGAKTLATNPRNFN